MVSDLFIQLSLIVIIALIVSLFTFLFKQPLIIGYIIAGILVSPHFLNLVHIESDLAVLAKLGVALLLFMVGLNLNPKTIKEVGKVVLITGFCQTILIFSITFALSRFLNFSQTSSFYIGLALIFNSTIVITKLLADKGEINTLPGRITIGILILQDIIAIVFLMGISSFTSQTNLISLIINSLLKGLILISFTFLFGFYILKPLAKLTAKSQELLLLFSIAWCVSLGSLFHFFNFSVEIGALLAGITLSLSEYRFEISSRLRPLRDFFLLIFFIILGSQMHFTEIKTLITPIIIFSLIVLILGPLLTTSIISLQGYTKRNSFLTSLNLTHISEFSFIILALGVSLNHISTQILSIMTLVALITMALSSYLILYSTKIYSSLARPLSIFERKGKKLDDGKYHTEKEYDALLLGYNRIGFDLLESFKKSKINFLVVDYNPTTIEQLVRKGYDCRYGDASDPELLEELNIRKTKMIVSTIPDFDTNVMITRKIRRNNKDTIIILISHQIDEALRLYNEGATYVIMPHFLGGRYTSDLIEKYGLNKEKFAIEKTDHIHKLKTRKKQGQEHPRHERG